MLDSLVRTSMAASQRVAVPFATTAASVPVAASQGQMFTGKSTKVFSGCNDAIGIANISLLISSLLPIPMHRSKFCAPSILKP